jgi:hypothetical protein
VPNAARQSKSANERARSLGLSKAKKPGTWAGAKPTRGAGHVSMGGES